MPWDEHVRTQEAQVYKAADGVLWLLMLLLVNTGLRNVTRSYKGFDSCIMYAYGSFGLYKYMYEVRGVDTRSYMSQQLVWPCLMGFSNYRALET